MELKPELDSERTLKVCGRLLRAALGFATLPMPSYGREPHALRSWLDSWRGIGAVSVGMHRQGYDLQLTQYDDRGWRATFYVTDIEHSLTSDTASAWVACGPGGGTRCAEEGRGQPINHDGIACPRSGAVISLCAATRGVRSRGGVVQARRMPSAT
jgi:hypothetical protein